MMQMKPVGKQFNKIPIHYGMKDYFKHYVTKYVKTKKNSTITKGIYSLIISDANQIIADSLIEKGQDFVMPYFLGTIGIRKYKPKLQLTASGKIINKLPINPMETRKLWDTNAEAKEKKVYVRFTNRHSDGFVFSLFFFKRTAKFKNKKAYSISYKRSLKRTFSTNIQNKVIDAFII
jgi:hypothetical protein